MLEVLEQELAIIEQDVELSLLHGLQHEQLVVRVEEERWRLARTQVKVVDAAEVLRWDH